MKYLCLSQTLCQIKVPISVRVKLCKKIYKENLSQKLGNIELVFVWKSLFNTNEVLREKWIQMSKISIKQ